MKLNLTKYNSWDDGKADPLDENMQPPVRHVLSQLPRRELQTADEKDEGDGAVEDAIL